MKICIFVPSENLTRNGLNVENPAVYYVVLRIDSEAAKAMYQRTP